ncbi:MULTISPECIES: DUF6037 family protein [Bacillus cereus group]|uniref:DUF6037 family protein n=1 Tax=Bacillus cereus group TaxID=86661 RepID=UPI0014446B34|nr:DUF6037 family protein [Bacillus cereus]NKX58029.1 hypothetical protein [Bacillus cereus]
MEGTIRLTRLFSLSKDMFKKNLNYQVINGIRYKSELQICAIFKYDYRDLKKKKYDEPSEKKYTLGLFKRGTNDFLELPLVCEVKENGFKSFELPIELAEAFYKKLSLFLELEQSKHGRFSPQHFFNALNAVIPTKASEENLDRKVCSYSYPTSKDNEHEKVYFHSFRDNDKRGDKRSLENYMKTENLLPDANKVIGGRNISVCFTDTPKDEQTESEEINTKINEI